MLGAGWRLGLVVTVVGAGDVGSGAGGGSTLGAIVTAVETGGGGSSGEGGGSGGGGWGRVETGTLVVVATSRDCGTGLIGACTGSVTLGQIVKPKAAMAAPAAAANHGQR